MRRDKMEKKGNGEVKEYVDMKSANGNAMVLEHHMKMETSDIFWLTLSDGINDSPSITTNCDNP